MVFHTIESWASRLGYVVEKSESNPDVFIWYKEYSLRSQKCNSQSEIIEQIIEDIKKSYVGN